MPRIAYERPPWVEKWLFENGGDINEVPPRSRGKAAMIAQAISILEDYKAKGYNLTLRQLYYQFVSKDLIPNNQKSYDKLGIAVSEGRMWGLIDWNYLVDRGRNFYKRPHWTDAANFIVSVAYQFSLDRWADSDVAVEVWVEKQAFRGGYPESL